MFNEQPPPPRSTPILLFVAIGLFIFVLVGSVALALVLLFGVNWRTIIPFGPAPSVAAPPDAPIRTQGTKPSGTVKIEENFDQPTDRWDQSQARMLDGTYELGVSTPNNDNYGLFLGDGALPSFDVADVDIAVDAQQVSGDPTAEYGIRFRQSGPEDYLMFSISSTGYYRLVRVQNAVFRSEVPWTFDRSLRTGLNATNRLRVDARGTAIICYINDRKVIEFADRANTPGQLTLGVQSFTVGDLAVRFDNLVGQAIATALASDGTTIEQTMPLTQDFTNAENAPWSVGGAEIVNHSYEIFTGGGVQTWQTPLPSGASRVADFVLDVDATLVSGDVNQVAYGVIFGEGTMFDFYSLLILPTGELTLVQNLAGGGSVTLMPPVPIAALNPGLNATNRITVRLAQGVFKVTINNEQLNDLTLPPNLAIEGMVGMIVVSGPTGLVQARFDNFRLQELSATQSS